VKAALKALRESKGHSLAQLALAAGEAQKIIDAYCYTGFITNNEARLKILQALGVESEEALIKAASEYAKNGDLKIISDPIKLLTVARDIGILIDAQNETQDALALKAGIASTTVRKICSGRPYERANLEKLLKALNVPEPKEWIAERVDHASLLGSSHLRQAHRPNDNGLRR
jgi:transcriptional regulator with XRE-family HTH domain